MMFDQGTCTLCLALVEESFLIVLFEIAPLNDLVIAGIPLIGN